MSNPIEDALRLGHDAESVMNSEAFKLAMEELEVGLTASWANGQFKDTAEREDAFYRVQAARAFRLALISLLDKRKVAKDRIERDNKRAEMRG